MRTFVKLAVIGVFAATVAAVPTGTAFAAQTIVVHPGDSIQHAINKAKSGDTIKVLKGTYRETLVIQKNDITLWGVDHPTIKLPTHPTGVCSSGGGDTNGICVVPKDLDPSTFTYTKRVRDVTIHGFNVTGFGSGIFAFGSDNLQVSDVRATDNDEYGIARFDSLHGYIKDSFASNAGEADFYFGDSIGADAVGQGNTAVGGLFGFLIRHVRDATFTDNEVSKACVGMVALNDGQPEGVGNLHIANNYLHDNNAFCPGDSEEGTPDLGGIGILLAGADHNLVEYNRVDGNNAANTEFSGGIVVAMGSVSNSVRHNKLSGNKPVDILQDSSSTPNRYNDNRCKTSDPAGLCD
jgi:nitrous oxidase accessory protein NosD